MDEGEYQGTHHKTGHCGLCTSRTRSNNYIALLTSADNTTFKIQVLARREEARFAYKARISMLIVQVPPTCIQQQYP
jgi:hypothetical protein